ncbi:hepatic sodium/bile acid cotransporter-like [Watersipora subatra]|uniref:hepatic sodium/bile acid cotransporter-like n=1 Tax=Watersipora subatra TaxID=2589382 RepID=UPI00355C528C
MLSLYIYSAFLLGHAVCLPNHLEGNTNQTLFRLTTPADKVVTVYFDADASPHSATLFARKTLSNFTFTLESARTDVAVVSKTPIISRCHEKSTWNRTSNTSYLGFLHHKNTTLAENFICYNLSFNGTAVYLGYSPIKFYATLNGSEDKIYVGQVLLRSIRQRRTLDAVYNLSVVILLVIVTLAMGNDLNFETIKDHLRTPKAPVVALLSQYTIMPLLSYSVIRLLGFRGGQAFGYFVLGCSPGGGTSNMMTRLFNADMSLSVTLTTLSTAASLGMLPMWLYTLGTTIPAEEGVDKIKLPFLGILQSLAMIVIPIMLGNVIRLKLPRLSKILKQWLNALFIMAILFFFTFCIYVNMYIFVKWDAKVTLAACAMPYGGYILGGLIAWICRFDWTVIKTISIETGMQNAPVCVLVVLTMSIQPDSDLAIILPIATTIVAGCPFYLMLPIYLLRERMLRKRQEEADALERANSGRPELDVKSLADDDGSCKGRSKKRNKSSDVEMKPIDA